MQAQTRAWIAAAAYTAITGQRAAGLYDHAAGQHLRIAAERRGNQLQGADGERSARFSGTLPELYDEGEKVHVSLEVEGQKATGFDRGSQEHYEVQVTGRLIRFYDHGQRLWFAFEAQSPDDAIPTQG